MNFISPKIKVQFRLPTSKTIDKLLIYIKIIGNFY